MKYYDLKWAYMLILLNDITYYLLMIDQKFALCNMELWLMR